MKYQFEVDPRSGYVDVPVSVIHDLPKEVRFIDVREPEEFDGELGHLGRAELVPLGNLSKASSGWSKHAPLLLICRSGNRSGQAARALSAAGFTNLGNLSGGMLAFAGR